MSRVIARLLQRPQAAATQALADQDCLAPNERLYSRRAGLVCQKIRLNI